MRDIERDERLLIREYILETLEWVLTVEGWKNRSFIDKFKVSWYVAGIPSDRTRSIRLFHLQHLKKSTILKSIIVSILWNEEE